MSHLSEVFLKRAQWLGYLGLIPFIIAMVLMMLLDDTKFVAEALHNYAAIILTFVGAIHWGRALYNGNTTLMSFSVVASLIAWFSLLLTPSQGVLLAAAAFIAMLFIDRTLYHKMNWFKQLRTRLSVVVSASLVVSWLYINPTGY
jgi:cation transport ATPase